MEWTREQKQAIETNNCNLLVAAGAGSGKTAVLVERIINKIIKEKIDVDKLLVVTFTNAAASEMREKISESIYKELEKDSALQKQVLLLNKASITTIHSFCLRVIRDNFFKADLDPNFRVGEETECKLLKLEALDELLEEKYEVDDKQFENIVDLYTENKGDTNLRELILSIHNFIQSAPFPNTWLHEKCEMYSLHDDTDFSDTPWGKIIIENAREEICRIINELTDTEKEIFDCPDATKYLSQIQDDILSLRAIIENNDTWDKLYDVLLNVNFTRTISEKKAPDEIKELVKDKRKLMRDTINNLKNNIFVLPSCEVKEDLKELYENLTCVSDLVVEFDDRYKEKKKEKNIIDFSDIEHISLKILTENIDIANMYKEYYEEIYVDEYQDSSLVQEYILNTISKDRMFMVGDVKQSIYKFRQASPELFLSKYNTYKTVEDDGENSTKNKKVLLFKNFRSNKSIVNATNYVFKQIMSEEIGEIEYTEDEYLKFGADYYETDGEPVELHLIESKKDEEESVQETILETNDLDTNYSEEMIDTIDDKPQLEGRVIAKRIKELVGKVDVYDKKLKTYRKAKYKDIVILLRATKGTSDYFMQELSNMNIPVYTDNKTGYFENSEIQIITNLLKIIDNPMQDIPLISVLRSQIGAFTIDELTEIRLIDKRCNFYEAMQKMSVNSDKVREFLTKLSTWREESKYLSLNELLWKLYIETGYYYYVSLMPDGIKRQANLKLLLERADNYEKTSYKGLFNFLNYIDNIRESSGDMGNSKIIGENEDVVRIMSIHKSKGLEFPIVFLAGTGKLINNRNLSNKVILHQDLGFGADMIKYDKHIFYSSIPKLALAEKIKNETLSEEMRILYVAMTRAREKLIITGLVSNLEKTIDKYSKNISKYSIANARCFLDWIGSSVINKDNDWKIINWKYNDVAKNEDVDENNYKMLIKNIENNYKDNGYYKLIDNRLSWKYPYEKATTLATKISITELKRKFNRTESDDIQSIIEKPKFMDKEDTSGAKYGTIFHNIIQHIDFKNPDIDKTINAYVKDKEINIGYMKKQLEKFLDSDLAKRISRSDKVYKETPFNLNISTDKIFDLGEECKNEEIMIQGIIDLFFVENNEVVLVDYKTDNVESEKELIERYKIQLDYYKTAIEKITKMKVKETLIYSLKLDKEILLT